MVDLADFNRRCRALNARIDASEPMSIEYIAEQLGMSFEAFAAALAVEITRQAKGPVTVLIDTSSAAKTN